MPLTLVKLFMGWAAGHYKPATIQTTLSALAEWHRSKGLDLHTLNSSVVGQLSQAIRVFQGPEGVSSGKQGICKSLIIKCLETMRKLKTLQPHMEDLFTRDAAWLVMGFFGLLRRSELIALRLSDVVTKKDHVVVHIRRSKTDQEGKGATVVLPAQCRDSLRVRRIIDALLQLRTRQGATPEDHLITAWDLDSLSLSSSPLLSGQALSYRLKSYLTAIALSHPKLDIDPARFAMHSLRRGGAVAAWANGADLETIRTQGRWKSDAIKAYLIPDLSVKLSGDARRWA